jgi:hypothetical protein
MPVQNTGIFFWRFSQRGIVVGFISIAANCGAKQGEFEAMKKFVLAVLVAAIAASPALAAKKKSKKVATETAAASTASSTDNSVHFVKDSLPIFLPSWSMPAYMAVSQPQK